MLATIARYADRIELLNDLLVPASNQKLLIICSTKVAFLQHIVLSLPSSEEANTNTEVHRDHSPTSLSTPALHPLLIPTIAQLDASKEVHLAFCPTTSTLRAYLSTLPPQSPKATIIILDLISLHHSTSEFSVQGLSRTLALAVSAATARRAQHLRLVECADPADPTSPAAGYALWDAQVPLLSASVKLRGEGANWAASRSNIVRRVATRWFRFEAAKDRARRTETNAPQDEQAIDMQDEEMLV